MLILEYSDTLKRKIRKDKPLEELGMNTFTRLEETIREGKTQEALDLVEYLWIEGHRVHELYSEWTYTNLIYVAEKYGEEEIPKMLEYTRAGFEAFYPKVLNLQAEELVIRQAEAMRAHRTGPTERGDFLITEEKDRYVMKMDPCGSGGRMRRRRATSSPNGELSKLGVTQKPYPWSWSKAGVPYYCIHCCLWHEILPIKLRGYPLRVTGYSDDPMAPCYYYYYKDPLLIPEHYFTRVGKKKDPSMFKK